MSKIELLLILVLLVLVVLILSELFSPFAVEAWQNLWSNLLQTPTPMTPVLLTPTP